VRSLNVELLDPRAAVGELCNVPVVERSKVIDLPPLPRQSADLN
jgi:hypothetical protein